METATGLETSEELAMFRYKSSQAGWDVSQDLGQQQAGCQLLGKTHHLPWHELHPRHPRHSRSWPPGSHLAWRLNNVAFATGGAVLLLRSPFDAIRSYWNHDKVRQQVE